MNVKSNMVSPDKYTELCAEFATNGCKLLTTFDELKQCTYLQHTRLKFVGTCNHESSAVYTNFHVRKTGINCKDCVKTINKSKREKKCKEYNIENEKESLSIITSHLTPKFEVIRTPEGCNADFIVKPRDSTEDAWLPVQLKTTHDKMHNMYGFNKISKRYTNMLIICHSLKDNKLWAIYYCEDMNIPSKLNITDHISSKYNKHKLDINTLSETISSKFHEYTLNTKETFITPANKYQQREILYANKRMDKISFIKFETMDMQMSCSDFKVNNKLVQEKVVGAKKCNSYIFQLSRRNGSSKKYRTYMLGENHVYWFHSAFNDLFWIVPEEELHKHGLISNSGEIKPPKHFCVNPSTYKTYEWLKLYAFDYSNIASETEMQIKKLFSIV